jgi:hypothetical protein
VVAYNLERQEMFTMALPGENEQVWEPYIYGNLIAWVRVLQFDQTDGHSILEWTELP